VTVTRATLASGTAIAAHPVAGVQLVVAEAGQLAVGRPTAAGAVVATSDELLIPDPFPISGGTASPLRNAGSTRLDLIVVTIDPALPRGGATGDAAAAPGGTPLASPGPTIARYPPTQT
jgi:hypothetical protein